MVESVANKWLVKRNGPSMFHITGLIFYTPPHKKWRGIMLYPPNFECPSVRLSVSTSFPCSNFSTFWPIFFKLCIDIGIGEEWYGIASGPISFWNNRVMALDVCQKCFALHFRALTLVPLYPPNFECPSVRLSVSASFPCSNFSTFWPIFFKLCIDIGIGEEWYLMASGIISFRNNRVMALDLCPKCIFGQYLKSE